MMVASFLFTNCAYSGQINAKPEYLQSEPKNLKPDLTIYKCESLSERLLRGTPQENPDHALRFGPMTGSLQFERRARTATMSN